MFYGTSSGRPLRRPAGRGHRGFTLVELLVVISIIGVLIALLMPAVNAAREAGRQTTCRNNLKQIGTAFSLHHEKYNCFPTGGFGPGAKRTLSDPSTKLPATTTQTWAWGYQILPFIEMAALWSNPEDDFVAGTPIPLYFCPTRRRPVALTGGTWQTQSKPRAMCDYGGNAGSNQTGGDGSAMYGNGGVDGIVARQGAGLVSLAHIKDGAQFTFLMGEKRMNTDFCTTECQPDDNDGYVGGFSANVVRWGAFPPKSDFSAPPYSSSDLSPGVFQFGSSHAAGVLFAFCDGGIRLVAYDVNPDVFRRGASRNDMNPVGMEKLY